MVHSELCQMIIILLSHLTGIHARNKILHLILNEFRLSWSHVLSIMLFSECSLFSSIFCLNSSICLISPASWLSQYTHVFDIICCVFWPAFGCYTSQCCLKYITNAAKRQNFFETSISFIEISRKRIMLVFSIWESTLKP